MGGLQIHERVFQNGNINKSIAIGPYSISKKTPGLAIKYISKGEEQYITDGKERVITNGQFILIRHDRHFTGCQNEPQSVNHGLCINIEMHDDLETMFDNDILFDIIHYSQNSTGLGKVLNQVNSHSLSNVQDGRNLIKSIIDKIRSLHEETMQIKGRLQTATMKKETLHLHAERLMFTREFIYSNFYKKLSLDILSRKALMSKFHFQRLFQRAFDQSPNDLLHQLRLEKALLLMQEKRMKVSQVARMVGYPSHSAFSIQFKKRFGCAPSQYCKMYF